MTVFPRIFRPLGLPAAALLACGFSQPASAIESPAGSALLEDLSLSANPTSVLTVCHGFGCAYRNQFVLTPARLANLRGQLQGAHSAKEERKILGSVVAWFDREGGRVAGTVGRVAYAGADTKSGPSQMDCIDLTANITELLNVLQRVNAIKFHRVDEPVSRGLIVGGNRPHTTPVIVEIADGTQWSVDSWTRAYGQRPEIMTISEWKNRN